jgi:hypothetical protein
MKKIVKLLEQINQNLIDIKKSLNVEDVEEVVENIVYNFDVTANWVSGDADFPVTDKASFVNFLTSAKQNDLTSVVVTGFSLDDNRLKCNLVAEGTRLDLSNMQVTEAVVLGGVANLNYLHLNDNGTFNINSTTLLFEYLLEIYLSNNGIEDFNPTNSVFDYLTTIDLSNNQITDYNPTTVFPRLKVLELGNNKMVKFNPSNVFTNNLTYLGLSHNQMTTEGYAESEAWANAQPKFTAGAQINIFNNVDSIVGTHLKDILLAKNVYVRA